MQGTKLAHYEIQEKLGAGGMGEVYRAHDTRLGRDVAVKILPAEFARDPSRLARFEREARVIAALNHPNIVTVHSVEEADGVRFLTMELVNGQTLSRLMPNDGLPLERFFDLAIPLADALAAAHAKNITHRDLKPANIMVDEHRRLKVLDFGLAKLLEDADRPDEDTSSLRTRTMGEPLTGEGRIVGTPQYMSPEQAAGDVIDSRSDIFSLGTVLYEMATGACPFTGDSRASVISSILRDTPSPVTEIKKSLPRPLGRIVMRCLARDPDRRFQTALDVRNELQELRREIDSGELQSESNLSALATSRSRRRIAVVGIAALFVVIVLAISWLRWGRSPGHEPGSDMPHVRLAQLTNLQGGEYLPAISPDGRMVAYARGPQGNMDVFLQRTDGKRAINLTADSPMDDTEPAFSPDGSHIAFRSEREGGGIFIMGTTGESPRRVTTIGHSPAWSPDGRKLALTSEVVFYPTMGPDPNDMWIVDVASGKSTKILHRAAANPAWSPHGLRLAYWQVDGGQRDIWTIKPDGSDPQRVTHDRFTDWCPQWSRDGAFLYFLSDRGGAKNIWRMPMNEASGTSRGEPEPVTTGTSETLYLSISRDRGDIAASVTTYRDKLERSTFDPDKEEVQGSPTLLMSSLAGTPDVSPNNQAITYMSMDPQEDIAVTGIDGTGARQLTDDVHRDRFPRWSPTGDRIAFFSNRSGKYEIWTIRPDGGGLRQETDVANVDLLAPSWSPDGQHIACGDFQGKNYIIDLTSETEGRRRLESLRPLPPFEQDGTYFFAGGAAWSPDGRRLAGNLITQSRDVGGIALYSLDTARYDVLRRFDPPLSPGFSYYWLPDGRRLAYTRGNDLVVLDTESRKEHVVPMPELAQDEFRVFVLSRDGSLLLTVEEAANTDIWLVDLDATTN